MLVSIFYLLNLDFMKTNEQKSSVQKGAEVYKEQCAHETVMKRLSEVSIGYVREYGDYCPFLSLKENKLSNKELWEILERNRSDEILYMIHRYGNCGDSSDIYVPDAPNSITLPEEIQEAIALRGNKEEIDAYLSYQGFGEKGQNVILNRGDHAEILSYVERHGLLEEQQRKLIARGNKEEIDMHIRKHGLASKLLDEMFAGIASEGRVEEFYAYIAQRELPVAYQCRMLEVVAENEFLTYIGRYGLWTAAHVDLIKFRSDAEIASYIKKHHFLSSAAEEELAAKANHELIMCYINNRYKKVFSIKDSLLPALLSVRPLDYEAITAVLLNFQYPAMVDENSEKIANGTHEEVMAYVKEVVESKSFLSSRAFAALFFRNNQEELETYLDGCGKVYFFS